MDLTRQNILFTICRILEATNPMNDGDVKLTSKDSSAFRDALCEIAARHPFAESRETLEEFVRDWERGTLPKARWMHGAHVGVAAYFAYDYPSAAVLQIMRLGIRHFNLASGGANTEDQGYHETLTRFWTGVVGNFVRDGRFASRLEAVRSALLRFGEHRDYHRSFYSFDVLADRNARREWVSPDREVPGDGGESAAQRSSGSAHRVRASEVIVSGDGHETHGVVRIK
jgi:hypothetical protein